MPSPRISVTSSSNKRTIRLRSRSGMAGSRHSCGKAAGQRKDRCLLLVIDSLPILFPPRRPDGHPVLARPAGARRVALHRRDTDDLIAEELRRREPDEVYAETLRALAGGSAP